MVKHAPSSTDVESAQQKCVADLLLDLDAHQPGLLPAQGTATAAVSQTSAGKLETKLHSMLDTKLQALNQAHVEEKTALLQEKAAMIQRQSEYEQKLLQLQNETVVYEEAMSAQQEALMQAIASIPSEHKMENKHLRARLMEMREHHDCELNTLAEQVELLVRQLAVCEMTDLATPLMQREHHSPLRSTPDTVPQQTTRTELEKVKADVDRLQVQHQEDIATYGNEKASLRHELTRTEAELAIYAKIHEDDAANRQQMERTVKERDVLKGKLMALEAAQKEMFEVHADMLQLQQTERVSLIQMSEALAEQLAAARQDKAAGIKARDATRTKQGEEVNTLMKELEDVKRTQDQERDTLCRQVDFLLSERRQLQQSLHKQVGGFSESMFVSNL